MKTARLLTVVGVLGFAVLAEIAPAAAVPPQAVVSDPPEILTGYCPFDVELEVTDNQNYVFTTLADGSTLLTFRGAAFATLTNVDDPEKSVTLNVSGPGDAIFRPGTLTLQSGDVRGLNFLRTTAANSFPGVPTLNYTQGRATFEVAPDGKTTDFVLRGRSTDICAALS